MGTTTRNRMQAGQAEFFSHGPNVFRAPADMDVEALPVSPEVIVPPQRNSARRARIGAESPARPGAVARGNAPDPRLGDSALSLLRADNVEAVADAVLAQLDAGHGQACIAWSTQWPHAVVFHPADARSTARLAQAGTAVLAARAADTPGQGRDPQARVLFDDGHGGIAVLLAPTPASRHRRSDHHDALLDIAGRRMAELLALRQLHDSVAQLAQGEQVQRALYAIADMAGSGLDMPDMLRGVHRIVSELMYAENFYIALHNRERDTLRFIYFVDTEETEPPPADELPMSRFERGLTWYVINDARPLMGTDDELSRQVSGPLQMRGTNSSDWLGVPMLRDGRAHGALVVQSYLPDRGFSASDQALLAFVADHILTALERKSAQEALEARVEQRTRELARANDDLRVQIAERERGERLQAALYKIAALASADESAERFYAHIHMVVSELLNAENFYIALLSDDGATLHFPYSVDQFLDERLSRPRGRGLTEYVLRTGKPELIDRQRALQLMDEGEIARKHLTDTSNDWLGVPLIGPDATLGAVVVQSYRPDLNYSERDAELLTFVSHQIASSLQRRNSANALKQLNSELEQRVQQRTAELREQIAVRERVEAQLLHQVMHDSLTGLPNRVYLRDRLKRAIAQRQRDAQCSFGLLYIDVDRFKIVNDSLGHAAGDAVLEEVARRLSRCVREPDVVARLAGDEFAILLEHMESPETAVRVAQRILDAMNEQIELPDESLQTGVSIGIAIGDSRHRTTDEALRDADTALYRAKSSGRNRYVVHDDSFDQAAMNVLALEQELRRALAQDEFEPWFQPLVGLEDAQVIGYEALLRWRHPLRGMLVPGDFLQVAEDSGLIEPIDWRMFRLAMEHGKALVRHGGYITINVSPRHFQPGDLDQRLMQVVRDAGFDPTKLRIEVTEGTLLGDSDAAEAMLHRLREVGIEVALDDFGTGYSSLGHVHRFPLRMIKIDRSFIAPIGPEEVPRTMAVIGAILALSRSLGVEVVAEGIETRKQRETLQAMGCVLGQGYAFGRPQPAGYWLQQQG
jgi:diguanylate cyclase (GGDEF)-like protein